MTAPTTDQRKLIHGVLSERSWLKSSATVRNLMRLPLARLSLTHGMVCPFLLSLHFLGRLRQECLNEHWFMSLADAQDKIEA